MTCRFQKKTSTPGPAKSRQDLFRQGWTKGLRKFSGWVAENCFLVCFRMVEKNPWFFGCFFLLRVCCFFFWGGWNGGNNLEIVSVIFRRISGTLKWTSFGSRSDNTRCPKSMGFPMDSILKPDLNKLQTKTTMFVGKISMSKCDIKKKKRHRKRNCEKLEM